MPDRPDWRKILLARALEICSDVQICNEAVDRVLATLGNDPPWAKEKWGLIDLRLEVTIKNLVGWGSYDIFFNRLYTWARGRGVGDCLADEASNHAMENWLLRNEFSCSCVSEDDAARRMTFGYLKKSVNNIVFDRRRETQGVVSIEQLENERVEDSVKASADAEREDRLSKLRAKIGRARGALPAEQLRRLNAVLYSQATRHVIASELGISKELLDHSVSQAVRAIFDSLDVPSQRLLATRFQARQLPHHSDEELAEMRLFELLTKHACIALKPEFEEAATACMHRLEPELEKAVEVWIESGRPLRDLEPGVRELAREGANRMADWFWIDCPDLAHACIRCSTRRRPGAVESKFQFIRWFMHHFVTLLEKRRPNTQS